MTNLGFASEGRFGDVSGTIHCSESRDCLFQVAPPANAPLHRMINVHITMIATTKAPLYLLSFNLSSPPFKQNSACPLGEPAISVSMCISGLPITHSSLVSNDAEPSFGSVVGSAVDTFFADLMAELGSRDLRGWDIHALHQVGF